MNLSAGGQLQIQVTGQGGVPAGATGVLLNTTVTDTTAGSFLTIYPTGQARPLASNLNWIAGVTVPNLVEVPLGSGGQVTAFNLSGSADVVADVEGYYGPNSGSAPTGLFNPVAPARVCDTRPASTSSPANQCSGMTLTAGGTQNVQVGGQGGVPASGVGAVVLNITVTNTTAGSFLTAYPAGQQRPNASNLNWTVGQTVPNPVVVPVTNGSISLFNLAANADVIVDVGDGSPMAPSPQPRAVPIPHCPHGACATPARRVRVPRPTSARG